MSSKRNICLQPTENSQPDIGEAPKELPDDSVKQCHGEDEFKSLLFQG